MERSPWYSFRLMLVTISLVAFSSRFESRQRLSALSITCPWLSNKRSDQINVQRANFRNWLTFTDWCFKWISRQPKLVFFQTMSFFLRLFESEDDVNATKVWKIMRMQFPPNKSKSSKVVTYFVANHLATIFSSLEIGLPRLSWDFCVKNGCLQSLPACHYHYIYCCISLGSLVTRGIVLFHSFSSYCSCMQKHQPHFNCCNVPKCALEKCTISALQNRPPN